MSQASTLIIRIVWDYFGPASRPTAAHFLNHLKDFVGENAVTSLDLQLEVLSPTHAAVFLDTDRMGLDIVGPALRPHRVYEVSPSE